MTKNKPRISRRMVREYLRTGSTKRFNVSNVDEFTSCLLNRTRSVLGPLRPQWLKDLQVAAMDLIKAKKGKFTSKDLLSEFYYVANGGEGNRGF